MQHATITEMVGELLQGRPSKMMRESVLFKLHFYRLEPSMGVKSLTHFEEARCAVCISSAACCMLHFTCRMLRVAWSISWISFGL